MLLYSCHFQHVMPWWSFLIRNTLLFWMTSYYCLQFKNNFYFVLNKIATCILEHENNAKLLSKWTMNECVVPKTFMEVKNANAYDTVYKISVMYNWWFLFHKPQHINYQKHTRPLKKVTVQYYITSMEISETCKW